MPNVNRVHIHVADPGDGEPFVLVHGSWSDHRSWDALVAELPTGLRAVRYDRRGHSASERPPGPGSVHEDVADLAAIVEALAAGAAHVVGSSFGATIALRLAIGRADLVRSLAVHEPPLWSLASDEPAVRSFRAGLEPVLRLLEAGAWEDAARLFAEHVFGPGAWGGGMTDEMKRVLIANAPTFLDESRDPDAYAIETARLTDIIAPTLLSTGDQSPPAFHAVVDRLTAAMPHAERATLPGAGHLPHRTHPAEHAALLTSFWARAGSPAASPA